MSYMKAHETVPGSWGALPKCPTIVIIHHTIIMKHLDLKIVNKGRRDGPAGKVLVAKPDDLSSIPAFMWWKETPSFHGSSGSYGMYTHTQSTTHK